MVTGVIFLGNRLGCGAGEVVTARPIFEKQ